MDTLDTEILKTLIREVRELRNTLRMKGVTVFEESAETGMLRISIVNLIGDLQLYKVLPAEFHVSIGRAVRHLGPKDN
jgi:hypothetical protein